MIYDTQRAWRSWDTGRRLAPQWTLVALTRFEQSLVAQFPEYF
jgi:hypothetical protein